MKDLVDAKRMRAAIEHLASFPTRHTLSSGNLASAEWLAAQYREIPGMSVEIMKYTAAAGPRIPEATEVVQVVATLQGKTDRRIMIGGHFDSLNLVGTQGPSDVAKVVANRAPGANDDASGVVVALEAARALSAVQHENTLVFVAFSGEEQGLHGSKALAARAKAEDWKVEAVLSNDTVGSSSNKAGQKDAKRVRIFSEESRNHASRDLARYIEWISRNKIKAPGGGHFGPKLVFRQDRFGRGGDHSPFNAEGFTAVRFIEVHEEYTRQHTPEDLPEFMDWEYLANVARLNILAMQSLGSAMERPQSVQLVRDQGHDTKLSWAAKPGTRYAVYWRETTSPTWQGAFEAGENDHFLVKGINKDDHFFAVGAAGGIPVPAN